MLKIILLSLSFFFLNSGRGLEDPRFYKIKVAGTKFWKKPLYNTRTKNLKFEERGLHFTKNTLQINISKKCRAWVPLPRDAGVLQALPPRNMTHMLEHPSPA
jgi:hypothetical protein